MEGQRRGIARALLRRENANERAIYYRWLFDTGRELRCAIVSMNASTPDYRDFRHTCFG